MTDDRDDDEKVGYGRPPRQHQFKPGQSGNAKGRPRKAHPSLETPRQMLMRPVEVNGKKMLYRDAYIMKQMHQAINVNSKADRFIAKLMDQSGLLSSPSENTFHSNLEGARESLKRKLDALADRINEGKADKFDQTAGGDIPPKKLNEEEG